MDDEFEVFAFPDMFPYGTGVYWYFWNMEYKVVTKKIFSTMVTEY